MALCVASLRQESFISSGYISTVLPLLLIGSIFWSVSKSESVLLGLRQSWSRYASREMLFYSASLASSPNTIRR
jgi:hypothetical protein